MADTDSEFVQISEDEVQELRSRGARRPAVDGRALRERPGDAS